MKLTTIAALVAMTTAANAGNLVTSGLDDPHVMAPAGWQSPDALPCRQLGTPNDVVTRLFRGPSLWRHQAWKRAGYRCGLTPPELPKAKPTPKRPPETGCQDGGREAFKIWTDRENDDWIIAYRWVCYDKGASK